MALTFEELQRQLRPEWGREHDGNGVDFDLLMLPSLSFEPEQIELPPLLWTVLQAAISYIIRSLRVRSSYSMGLR